MNFGFTEMLFLVGLGLLLFGPKKLAEISHQVGRAIAQFKRYTSDFQEQLTREIEIDSRAKEAVPVAAEPAALEATSTPAPYPSVWPPRGMTPVPHPVISQPTEGPLALPEPVLAETDLSTPAVDSAVTAIVEPPVPSGAANG